MERVDDWIKTLDPDVEWDHRHTLLPDFLRPRAGAAMPLVRHMADYLAGWNDYEVTAEELIDGGDEVVLLTHESRPDAGERRDPRPRSANWSWTIRDGRSVRLRVFKTRAQALEAAGLPE